MNMEKEIYITKVIKEGDDLVMLFQHDLLNKLNLEPDTIWQWVPQKNGTIILNRVDDSSISEN